MKYDFSRGQVRRSVETGDHGLALEGPDGNRQIVWDEITGAGVGIKRPTGLIDRLPTGDPRFAGLATAVSLASQLTPATDLLYVAFRPAGKRRSLYTLAIPTSGVDRQALLDELASHLGPRWITEPLDMFALRKRLGFSNWWAGPVLLLVLVLIVLLAWWLVAGRTV